MKKDVFRGFINFAPVARRTERAKMAREIYTSLFQGLPRFTLNDEQCENFSGALKNIIGEPALLEFCAGNQRFSEIITLDILNFVKTAKAAVLESANPYSPEYELLAESQKVSPPENQSEKSWNEELFQGVIPYLTELYPEDFDSEFWKDIETQFKGGSLPLAPNLRFSAAPSAGTPRNAPYFLKKYIHRKWKRLLDEKNSEWERSVIEEQAFDFMRQLKKQIANIETVSRTLKPESEDFGRLWNAARGAWQSSSYAVLDEYGSLFQRDLALRDLVRTLGKARKNLQCEYEYSVNQDYEEVHTKNPGGKTELSGVCESADLSAVLPTEIALLTDTDTEILFYKRYNEGRLQTYEYTEDVILRRLCGKSRNVKKLKRETEGAFILCVDTSGSMRGINEKLAKSIVFAILKFALKSRRRCYLISFSTEIETLELSDLSASLSKLLDFLSMSFNGGSSAFSALNETLKMLSTNAYKKANVVFVSDFVLPNLDSETLAQMRDAQKQDTLFHSILLGDLKDDGINQTMLDCFNSIAVYNPEDF